MDRQTDKPQWLSMEVSAGAFQHRMDEEAQKLEQTRDNERSASVYARLALMHQVAKDLATEKLRREGHSNPIVQIEELTDPPVFGATNADDSVIIYFSYVE